VWVGGLGGSEGCDAVWGGDEFGELKVSAVWMGAGRCSDLRGGTEVCDGELRAS